MAINVTMQWKVIQLYTLPSIDGDQNLVCSVEWELSAINPPPWGSRVMRGVIQLGKPTGPYIPYNTLTEDQVITWVKDAMGSTELARIENQVFQGALSMRNIVTAPQCIEGVSYYILSIGTTDWTAIGAERNEINLSFIATGPGAGSGTAIGPNDIVPGPGPWVV